MATMLVKVVTVTRRYVVVGKSSDREQYWEKNFLEHGRVLLGDVSEVTDVALRPVTETEQALFDRRLKTEED